MEKTIKNLGKTLNYHLKNQENRVTIYTIFFDVVWTDDVLRRGGAIPLKWQKMKKEYEL